MLTTNYRYVGLDFETTGLDFTKDEPIQIGIIEIDEQGKIIGEYQSLIKPDKKTDELKHIVGFITGLSISDLETAPRRETVEQEIQKFFGENTIIIGHNIKFDLDFLHKYFPTLTYSTSIDTMQLAQTIVHHTTSYALEILIEQLKSEKLFSTIFQHEYYEKEKTHDAFFDTKNSIKVFLYFIQYLYQIIENYPSIVHIINQTQSIWKEILQLQQYKNIPKITIQFPALQKIAPNNTNLQKAPQSINIDDLEHQKKYYIGDRNIKELLINLATNKNIILAFQNIQKLDIAKTILNEIGIKNIGFTKEEQTINANQFQKFLNKGIFKEEEMMFIIKYLSHLKKGLGVLNLNTPYDYKIYYYIKDTRNQIRYPIILTTHHGLFASIQDNQEFYKDYNICFFDTEQWYKSYNFFLSSPCDLYYTLSILESFLYQEEIESQIKGTKINPENELHQFVNMFQIYIGVLFNESKKLFANSENNMIQHDPIREHGDFYQSNLLRKQLIKKKEKLQTILSPENYTVIEKQFLHIQKVFDSVVTISKKMYGNSEFYFTYAEAQKFTDWKEFEDIFKNKIIFFSNTNTQLSPIQNLFKSKIDNTQSIINIPKIDKIIHHIQNQQTKNPEYSCFIFSPKKEESKKIFEDLCKNNIHTQATILVENITGGMGKNIFKAKQTKSKIIIGGYIFILSLYTSKIPLDDIIIFNAKGPSEQNILDDIKRYNITN